MGSAGREYVIGIDSSTSSTKAILFDLKGKIVATGTCPHPVQRPHPGWSEQPAMWYECLTQALRQLFSQTATQPEDIAAIGITHQRHSFVPVDENMRPLRPAILWNDVRCGEELEILRKLVGAEVLYRTTGIPPGPWSLPKILWLKRHEPEVFAQTYKFLLVHDFLVYKLTGNLVTTESSASATGCLDIKARNRWAEAILDELDIPVDKFVDTIQPAGTLLGTVSKAAAQETGLPAGTPVIATAGDQVCGCLAAGLMEEHQVGVNSGTSLTFQTLCSGPAFDPERHYILEISPLEYYAPETVVFSGVSDLLQWYKNGFGKMEEQQANETGTPVWEIILQGAAAVEPGCEGLMLIPFFQGVQAPYWSNEARGLVFGLNTSHTRHHLVRAILEGLGYESRRQISLLESGSGNDIREILLYGGASRSQLWCKTLANITGRVVKVSPLAEATALGAAICAAWGVKLFPDLPTAVKEMGAAPQVFNPDSELTRFYSELYEKVYMPFYGRVADLDVVREKVYSSYKQLSAMC